MENQRIYRICVIGDRFGKGGRDRLSGVLHYAADNPHWSLCVHILGTPGSPINLYSLLKSQHPDHLIVLSCDSDTAPIIADAQKSGLIKGKTLSIDLNPDFDSKIRRILDVRLDNDAIARESMKLLMRRGFTNFAYVGYRPEQPLSDARRDAVRKIACADGCPFFATDDADNIAHLAAWLKDLPKPCGIITYYDMRSRDVLDACRLARIEVPQQLAIVGSDDDAGICEATHPTLTSVLPDFENGSYLAAGEFDKMLRRKTSRKTPRTMVYGVKSVTERESSVDFRGGGLLVSTASEYIRQHATTRLSVQDIADFCHVSRRLLELRFRQILEHSVHDEIEQVRLRTVCTKLRETRIPLNEIVRQSGFSSLAYLCALFQRKFGCTMRSYRTSRTLDGNLARPPPSRPVITR